MFSLKRAAYRAMQSAFCLLLSTVCLLPSEAQITQAQQTCRKLNNLDVCGRFLEEWSKQKTEQAGIYVNGLPITARHAEISLTDGKTYEVQWFERARFEAHPENGPPYDVLLGLLGTSLAQGRGAVNPSTGKVLNVSDQPFLGISQPSDADGKGKTWVAQTRHSISGKILDYWNQYGGIKQFGFPLSEPFQEISQADGKPYTVQYFERNRFELHPEKPPPYEVELGLLGVGQYRTQAVPADQLPIAPPKGAISTRDTLTIAISQEPASLFPFFESADIAHIVAAPIYSGLVNRDAHDNLYPEVAWYVPTLENGGALYVGTGDDRRLIVKYKLRQGIKWSDGTEITAADTIYHYKLMMDPNASVQDRTLQEKIYNVDSPDRYTVIFNYMSYAQARDFYAKAANKTHFAFLKPFVDEKRPLMDQSYNTVGNILPVHILGKLAANKILGSDYAHNPVGSGPFKVERWDAGSQIILAQNPNYNLTTKPLLKRIIIKLISDPNQLIAQLRSGALDAATRDAFPTPTQGLNQLGTDQKVEYAPTRVWERIDFNLDRPFFGDKAVRQAIAYGINRQKVVDLATLGKSVVMHTFIPIASWASMQNPGFAGQWAGKFSLRKYEYDTGKANQILDQAGWARGPDGVRAKDGTKLSFTYATYAGNKLREQIAGLIATDLKAIGIAVKIQYVPTPNACSDCNYLPKRQHDFMEYSSLSGINPGGSDYESQSIPTPENNYTGSNYAGYRNPRFDQLSHTAGMELDSTKEAPLFAEMQQIWSEDLPAIPLYPHLNIEVHKASIINWETSGGSTPSLYKAAAMYFK